jgi:hypothetical protein
MAEAAAHPFPAPRSGSTVLHRALAQLVESPVDLRNRVQQAATGRASVIEALLHEIDTTVLPRELTVMCGDKPAAVLVAANRRLAGITLGRTADTGASADEPAVAARIFADRLRQLEAKAGSTGFTLRRRACEVPQGAGSCTVRTLSEALCGPQLSQLEEFRSEAVKRALTWISSSQDGQAVGADGSEELLERLDAVKCLLPAAAVQGNASRLRGQKPECLLLPLSRDVQIIAAISSNDWLLLALPAAEVSAVLSDWNNAFGAPA